MMSELDREQAGAIEDEAQDNDTPDDEIELTPVPTETQSHLKKMMRRTPFGPTYKDMPQRNFDTVRSIFAYVTKKMHETDWTEENTDAVKKAKPCLRSPKSLNQYWRLCVKLLKCSIDQRKKRSISSCHWNSCQE